MQFFYMIFSIITPFVLGLFVVIGMKYNISKEIKFCTTEVTKIQNTHRTLTKSLLNTNFSAKSLRLARKAADKAAKRAPNPVTLGFLAGVIITQGALRLYQKGIILTASLQYQKLQAYMISNKYFPKKQMGTLAVEHYPKNSASPSYRLIKNYKKHKAIGFTKFTDSKKNFLKVLKNIDKINRFFQFTCGATILQKGGFPSNIKLLPGK